MFGASVIFCGETDDQKLLELLNAKQRPVDARSREIRALSGISESGARAAVNAMATCELTLIAPLADCIGRAHLNAGVRAAVDLSNSPALPAERAALIFTSFAELLIAQNRRQGDGAVFSEELANAYLNILEKAESAESVGTLLDLPMSCWQALVTARPQRAKSAVVKLLRHTDGEIGKQALVLIEKTRLKTEIRENDIDALLSVMDGAEAPLKYALSALIQAATHQRGVPEAGWKVWWEKNRKESFIVERAFATVKDEHRAPVEARRLALGQLQLETLTEAQCDQAVALLKKIAMARDSETTGFRYVALKALLSPKIFATERTRLELIELLMDVLNDPKMSVAASSLLVMVPGALDDKTVQSRICTFVKNAVLDKATRASVAATVGKVWKSRDLALAILVLFREDDPASRLCVKALQLTTGLDAGATFFAWEDALAQDRVKAAEKEKAAQPPAAGELPPEEGIFKALMTDARISRMVKFTKDGFPANRDFALVTYKISHEKESVPLAFWGCKLDSVLSDDMAQMVKDKMQYFEVYKSVRSWHQPELAPRRETEFDLAIQVNGPFARAVTGIGKIEASCTVIYATKTKTVDVPLADALTKKALGDELIDLELAIKRRGPSALALRHTGEHRKWGKIKSVTFIGPNTAARKYQVDETTENAKDAFLEHLLKFEEAAGDDLSVRIELYDGVKEERVPITYSTPHGVQVPAPAAETETVKPPRPPEF